MGIDDAENCGLLYTAYKARQVLLRNLRQKQLEAEDNEKAKFKDPIRVAGDQVRMLEEQLKTDCPRLAKEIGLIKPRNSDDPVTMG